ncbi:MAG: hypothetical protein D6791_13805, partial [Chloroflexi bacterium]
MSNQSTEGRTTSLPHVTNLVLLAAALALGVAAWERLFYTYGLTATSDNLIGHLTGIGRDAMLAFPLALLALAGALTFVRRLGMSRSSWHGLLGSAAMVSIVWMFLAVPALSLHNLTQKLADTGLAPAQGATPTANNWWGSFESLAGLLQHGVRDTLVAQAVVLPLTVLLLVLLLVWEEGWPTLELSPAGRRRSSRALRLALAAPFILLILLLPGTGATGTPAAAQPKTANPPCDPAMDDRIYNIAAINVKITLNRFGDHDPTGFMYVLEQNIPAVRAQENAPLPDRVSHGLRKDPIQPLVIRANQGETLCIKFTNQLIIGNASLHIHGLPYTVSNGGGHVGFNPGSVAAPGGAPVYYRFNIPTDATSEGAYYFHDHGASRQRVSHGLFGTLVVEPAGSIHRDPETGEPLEQTTGGSNWEAIIDVPDGYEQPDFREFVLIYHEVGDEDFANILDANGQKLPVLDDIAGTYRPGSRAINYRSEPFRNRLALPDPEDPTQNLARQKGLGYSSYMFGDPATPIPRSYLGEPSKTRLMHGGSEVFHVHHLHGGSDRWPRNPKSDDPLHFASGLQKKPAENAHSTHLDSQSVGPGTSFNLEHECGAGGCQQAAGDFLFHCHIGHHYVSGMWSFWRVYDTLQPDLAVLPDRDPGRKPPQAVKSYELLGKTYEGKTLVRAADLIDPNTQRALEDWIESQLPPRGARFDGDDATVWDWAKVDTIDGPLYLGEPETTVVWANYKSPIPGQRPEIMFNPDNGRYAWPLLRPHLQRPPFSPNGHSGAPWLGETGTALRPDGLCPTDEVIPDPFRKRRQYPITAITLPIQVTPDEVDLEGMLFVLSEEKEAVRNGLKPKQPLAIRSNVGDCVDILLTSELEDNADNKFHSKVNMHSHFVQFDPQASDGVITGLSYEQSIRPYASENRTLATPAIAGSTAISVTNVARLRPGIWLGVGLGEGMCPNPTPGGDDVPCTEIRRIDSIAGNVVTLDQPLNLDHPAGQAVGVEFVRYAWYSDVDTGTVFWHDHVDFKNWDHGLFGAHIIEPRGSSYHDPATGAEVRSGTIVDIYVDPSQKDPDDPHSGSVGFGVNGSFREFMLFLHNRSTERGAAVTGGSINLLADPLKRRGAINSPGSEHLLAAPATAGDTTITLNTVLSVRVGNFLRVGVSPADVSLSNMEVRQVVAISGNTITVDQPLAFNHAAGEYVGGDHSVAFSSVTYGDPITPLPRAYVGDPFVIRSLSVVERIGAIRVTGHRFRLERFAEQAVLHDTTSLGVSERWDLVLDGGAGGTGGFPGDYLYYSTIGRDFNSGAWGIIRVHDTLQSDLLPLPDRPKPSLGAGFPQQTATGDRPLPASGPGDVCPAAAPVRSYDVSIFRQAITFSTGKTDSNGVIYALAADEADIVAGKKPVEPLILRVNHGECLEIKLTNHLGERASFSLGKLQFDPQGS